MYKNSLLFAGGPGGVENELRRMGGRLIFVISLCLALLGLVLLYQTHNPSGDLSKKKTYLVKEYVTFEYWYDNYSPFMFYTYMYANEYVRIYNVNIIEKRT